MAFQNVNICKKRVKLLLKENSFFLPGPLKDMKYIRPTCPSPQTWNNGHSCEIFAVNQ